MKNAVYETRFTLLNTTGKFLLLFVFLTFYSTAYAEKYKYDLSAKDLIAAYEDNAVSASKKYKGKEIRITGKITSIDNALKIGVMGGKKEGEPLVFLEDVIKVTFKNHKKINWEDIHNGQKISVIGKCKGKPFLLIEIEKAVLE